jgi:hypothetical protein
MTNDEIKMLLASRLEKKAKAGTSPLSDVGMSIPGGIVAGLIPGGSILANIASTAGGITGLVDNTDEAEVKKLNQEGNKWLSMLPGVAPYRNMKRRKELASRLGGGEGYEKPISEQLGSITSGILPLLLTTAGGAAIGHATGSEGGALKGTMIGAATGLGATTLAKLVSVIAAGIKARRTEDQQKQYEQGSVLANYLLPGAAEYNALKSFGYSQGEATKHRENAKDA